MRHVPSLVILSSLGGCSLLYNPSNIDKQMDAPPPPDARLADVNPALLELTAVKSPPLLEGQGTSNSVPAILVITGHQMLPEATVTLEPTTANPNVTLTLGATVVATDGDWIAVPVTAGIMMSVNDGTTVALTATVTQPGAPAKTIGWSLQGLDQIKSAVDVTIMASHPRPYSQVDLTGSLIFKGSTPESRGLVRTMGLLKITGSVTAVTDLAPAVSAAVAGGCPGGAGGTVGGCSAPTAGGPASGTAGGGGGGFDGNGGASTATNHGIGGSGTGEASVKKFSTNLGGGGGGGGGGVTGGGEGGATGGAVELSAGGDMTIGAVTMNGTPGGVPLVTMLGGGGGGAGGLIIVRAKGTTFATGAVSAAGGGGGGANAGLGGNGANGRIRFDTQTSTVPAGSTPVPHRGLMITPIAQALTRLKKPTITITGSVNDTYDLYIVNPDDANAKTSTNNTLTQASSMVSTPELSIGHNTICVLPTGATLNEIEAKNCIELAYLP